MSQTDKYDAAGNEIVRPVRAPLIVPLRAMLHHWLCIACDVPVLNNAERCPGCGAKKPPGV